MNVLNQVLRLLREKQVVVVFFFKTLLLIDKAHPSAPMEMYKETKMCSYAATIPVLLCVP